MFYKLINENEIKKAPKPLKIDGKDVFTNSEAIHNEQGYFRLLTSDYPQDDKNYQPNYRQQGVYIIQDWKLIDNDSTNEI
jgi:hypothetical protein